MDYQARSLEEHEKYHGKLAVASKVPLATRDDLATYYSPGVAAPCLAIAKNPEDAYRYTRKSNSVAIVSDGTAVLGLGNIGGLAWLPVMEWKAVLMKAFGGIDAIPLVLSTQDPDEIIRVVKAVAPTFGAINLEDIAAPACFYIEEQLQKELNIPVFHDDQHGTAVVVLAGLLNALKLINKSLSEIKIVMSGAGAAGIATAKLLIEAGATHLVMTDSKGCIHTGRSDLNPYKASLLSYNHDNASGTLSDALHGADVFIGVSQPNIVSTEDVTHMSAQPIIFALSNPNPEITSDAAFAWWAYIYASWRSDLPNQINNLLAFPGILRWALDARLSNITNTHKIAAAYALAAAIHDIRPDCIIPHPLDTTLPQLVAQAVANA